MSLFKTLFGGLGTELIVPQPAALVKAAESPASLAKLFQTANIDRYEASSHEGDSEPVGLTALEARSLSRMCLNTPGVLLRTRQFSMHGKRARSRSDVGYRLGYRDPEKTMDKRGDEAAAEIECVLERGERMTIKMDKWAHDIYECNRGVAEVAHFKGKPYAFSVEDGATFRWAHPSNEELNRERMDFDRWAVQWLNGRPVKHLAPGRFMWVSLNHVTDIVRRGYPPSVVELACEIVLDLAKAQSFNSNFWENGIHQGVMMKVKADMTDEQWESFKRQLTEQMKGVKNAHRLLALLLKKGMKNVSEPDDVEMVAPATPKDMEFRWAYGFFFRVLAAIGGYDLEEVGLSDPADTGKSSLQEADKAWKQVAGRERGLKPGLDAVAAEINEKIVWPINPDMLLTFQGMDALDPTQQADLDQKQGATLWTLNEMRGKADLPAVKWTYEHPENECPTNYVQLYTLGFNAKLAKDQAEQAQKQQALMAQQNAPQGPEEPPPGDDETTTQGQPASMYAEDANPTSDPQQRTTEQAIAKALRRWLAPADRPRLADLMQKAEVVLDGPPRPNRAAFPFKASTVFQGIPIDIEQCKGDYREGVDRDGRKWRVKMHAHYGEVRSHARGASGVMGARGADGDRLDCYVGPDAYAPLVVVVHQNDPVTGAYDEDKVVLGHATVDDALALYRRQYDRPGFYGGHSVMPIGEFKRHIADATQAGASLRKALPRTLTARPNNGSQP